MTHKQFYTNADINSPTWNEEMADAGQAVSQNGIRHIIFTHGTFAGDDPFGMNKMIDDAVSALPLPLRLPALFNRRKFTKKVANSLFRDVGNFTDDYIDIFANGVNNDLRCRPFIWSGRNNHIARLRAAVRLCNMLAKNYNPDSKTLLIGHSHAGQVFALITQLLEQGKQATKLLDIIADIPDSPELNIANFSQTLKTIADIELDIVTLGMPVRYHWGSKLNKATGKPRYRLLCVINDRDNDVHLSGLLFSKDGDYVQQFGKDGTDLPVLNPQEHALNERLDQILPEVKNQEDPYARQHPLDHLENTVSETVLVDYKDDTHNQLWPNFISSAFGHGVYTKEEAMLFNLELIVSNFYSTIGK